MEGGSGQGEVAQHDAVAVACERGRELHGGLGGAGAVGVQQEDGRTLTRGALKMGSDTERYRHGGGGFRGHAGRRSRVRSG